MSDGRIKAIRYIHLTVNHTYELVDSVLELTHKTWRIHGTHRTMLDSHLCEWMWRQRHRNNDLLDQIIVDIIAYFEPI